MDPSVARKKDPFSIGYRQLMLQKQKLTYEANAYQKKAESKECRGQSDR